MTVEEALAAAITLHRNGVANSYPSLPPVPVFDGRNDYWTSAQPFASVSVAKAGTVIEVVGTSAQGSFMRAGSARFVRAVRCARCTSPDRQCGWQHREAVVD